MHSYLLGKFGLSSDRFGLYCDRFGLYYDRSVLSCDTIYTCEAILNASSGTSRQSRSIAFWIIRELHSWSASTNDPPPWAPRWAREISSSTLALLSSSGVYICKSIVNDLGHGNFICKSQVNYLGTALLRADSRRGLRPTELRVRGPGYTHNLAWCSHSYHHQYARGDHLAWSRSLR